MSEQITETGLYWRPFGGNNTDQISGHCYQYTDITLQKEKIKKTTILVDLGKFDNHQALGIKNSVAAIPDIRGLLDSKQFRPEALFLTHSHPDHLNGIVHYLKAGYRLPPIYGGRYTQMILDNLYDEFSVPKSRRPVFNVITDGDIIKIGSIEIEAISSSHTCFDSLGFIIKSPHTTVYHTGDMKIDSSTYFRKPTNLRRLKELSGNINQVVADFCAITENGYAVKEARTYKKLIELIKKSRKSKIFIPVYPTHPEMYIIAFLAALKLRKNVIFYGNNDFQTYLKLIEEYGISFKKLAGKRIKVYYGISRPLDALKDNFAVIGTFNDLGNHFGETPQDSFGIITAHTYFNPLKGQFNSRNIKFTDVITHPELQGYGHGFLNDYEYINLILKQPIFIPTHCPVYVIDNFRKLADYIGVRLPQDTPHNNDIYRLIKDECVKIHSAPANWLVVNYNGEMAYFTEVWQKPTSGEGFLKRTISARRCRNKFNMYLHQRCRRRNS